MSNVEIWTDGSVSAIDRIGGWGAVVIIDGIELEISGSVLDTTINRMEAMAILKALTLVKSPSKIKVYTDSKYAQGGILKNGWGCGDTVKNNDLWKRMNRLVNHHIVVKPIWVRGHSNLQYNERADQLAGAARKKRVARTKPQHRCKKCEHDLTKQQMTQLQKHAIAFNCDGCGAFISIMKHVNQEVR